MAEQQSLVREVEQQADESQVDHQASDAPHSFEHKRREPAEWTELQEMIEDFDGERSGRLSVLKSRPLHRRIDEMNRETLDKTLYYGYGKVVCALAQRLAIPEHREDTIQSGIAEINRRPHASGEDFSVTLLDVLRENRLENAFLTDVKVAYGTMSKTDQIATEALDQARLSRDSPLLAKRRMLRVGSAMVAGILGGESAFAEGFASATTGGTSEVSRVVIGKAIRNNPGGGSQRSLETAIALLKQPGSESVFEQCGGVILRDLANKADDFVHLAEDGASIVYRDDRPSAQSGLHHIKDLNDYTTRHTPLVCPARSVPGTIPFVKDMVVEIIERSAQEAGVL